MYKQASRNTLILLWIACFLGGLSIIPYLFETKIISETASYSSLLVSATLQSAVIYAGLLWAVYRILPLAKINPIHVEKPTIQSMLIGIVSGISVGLLLVFLNKTFFRASVLADLHASSSWTSILASFYGAINEEVLMRLFSLTSIYVIIKKTQTKNSTAFWLANFLVALLFGLGHLPAAAKLIDLSFFETTRILLLNAIPSLLFGWIFFYRSLYLAMLAHYVTDIIIHVLF